MKRLMRWINNNLPDGDDEDMWRLLAIAVSFFVVFVLGVLLDWGPICHHASIGVC